MILDRLANILLVTGQAGRMRTILEFERILLSGIRGVALGCDDLV